MKDDLRPVTRALLSVSDKTGLGAFVRTLAGLGVEIISTGGTAHALAAEGLKVTDVADLTGFPEIMDGRVKTLHPKVHGALLAARDDAGHIAAMAAHGIRPIDLLVVNLYPFEATVAKGAAAADCVENIDIGGPAMIRAAAKNHADVAVLVEPEDYPLLLAELNTYRGATTLALRQRLAAKAYARTAAYDAAIANWFAERLAETGEAASAPYRAFGGRLQQKLRYGENPHQQAAFYADAHPRFGVATAEQLQGLELSYINILDADAAFELVGEFDPELSAAVAIIKHATPCGVATGATFRDAYRRAVACDPVSRFGGVIALNGVLDGPTAEEIVKTLTDVIIVPEADTDARALIAKRKNTRLLVTGGLPDPHAKGWTVRSVAGGLLVQTRDDADADAINGRVVTKRQPSAKELADLKFAFRVCKHVKSNAIVYAKDGATVGIGAGQMSRIDSARIAAIKARDAAQALGLAEPLTVGSVAASDAFFPFADGLLAIVEAGATAIIQPGGAMRDAEVIAAADQAGLAMVFSGVRQFRH
jgi:phosphoribosylaminoimidazolecarboxamide formyltransferase/IMP cyclohydrolase